ncbi:MAG TPA: extracellular solute-binding protein [Rhizomicrobium sp.]|jgi:putative spermidine/putrescine transport system substrate-binding protein
MKRSTRIILGIAALVLLIIGYVIVTRPAPVLTVTTWAGEYSRAQANAFFRPYSLRTGIDVRTALYDGELDSLWQQERSKQYSWDVVDFELPTAIKACGEGLLEKIDPRILPAGANGAPAAQDFVKNAIGPCWVGTVVYSQAIAYAPSRFRADPPKTLADFFNVQKYPGPRALRRSSAKFNMELALLADGVKPGDVYAVLSTPQGVDRALFKLTSIRSTTVWWNATSEPAQMLSDGRAAFSTILNGDIYDATIHRKEIAPIWDDQLYELDVFGIPKGNPNLSKALDFLRFATASQPLAAVSDWVPYGPARRSSLPFVGRNPDLKIAMRPFLPTTPENFSTAFAVDDVWWQANGPRIEARWQTWLGTP